MKQEITMIVLVGVELSNRTNTLFEHGILSKITQLCTFQYKSDYVHLSCFVDPPTSICMFIVDWNVTQVRRMIVVNT